jgi:hypothetical protein
MRAAIAEIDAFLHTCPHCQQDVDHVDLHEMVAFSGPDFEEFISSVDPDDVLTYWRCRHCGHSGAILDPAAADA